jgi:hypothetical protein
MPPKSSSSIWSVFGIMLLSILVKCCRQFDLYLFSFLSNGYNFKSSKIFSSLLVVKRVLPVCSPEKLYLFWCQSFFSSFYLRVHISLPYKDYGEPVHCILALLTISKPKFISKWFRIPSIWANFVSFCWISLVSKIASRMAGRTDTVFF